MASNSVGTAYLTLVPKLDSGFAKQAEGELGKSGDSGGDKFANGFSGKFKDAFKKLAGAAVVTKAGQMIGEQFMEAFNGYANFEQLEGGVEKIFGEAMSSQIINDANNAYKNLNMSANQYLETINDVGANFKSTMGAEKGYQTAQRGLQAIADYASGTGKNVDELKEKFTLITRATSSYQSIADQFSGILPATSDAFLEQAKAAGFLKDSYNKLSDVPIDEYQEAVAKMLEKGTADLGLMNNTANETFGTLSGSVAGAKAAWENFLTALGNPDADIDAAVGDLAEMLVAAGGQIVEAAGRIVGTVASNLPSWLEKIGNFIVTNAPTLGASVGNVIGQIVGWLVSSLPQIISAAVQLFGGLVTGLAVSAATATYNLITFIGDAVSSVAGAVGQMVVAAVKFIGGLITGFNNRASAVIQAVVGIIAQLPGRVLSFLGSMLSAGVSLLSSVANGIGSMAGNVFGAIANIVSQLPGRVRGFVGQMVSAGANLIQGLANGLSPSAVINKIKSICSSAVDQIKNFFGIHSPSRLMKEYGGYIGEGLAIGIGDTEKDVDAAMKSLASSGFDTALNYGIGVNASMNAGRKALNADVVGAIDMLHNDLYSIIKDATPDGITGRQFGRLVHKYA